jgi:thiopurine S-methyltransferase
MEPQFWTDRWKEGNIGFHRPSVNEHLLEFWPQIDAAPSASVLVPLCGKSLDLHWLVEQGHTVMGNEVVDLAVQDFFKEAQWLPKCEPWGALQRYSCGALHILCGDFFALTPQDIEGVSAWYDRAAQVALPPEMRQAYYQQLANLLPVGAVGLSLSFEYPQDQKSGPPFSVEEDELRALCNGRFSIELLARQDRLAVEPRLAAQGLTRADEAIYRMVRC